jgi:hypothetical protein
MRTDMSHRFQAIDNRITDTRVAIMHRVDRLQDAFTLLQEERIVDIGSAEQAEPMAKAAQEDAAAIGRIVTPLVRLMHGTRTRMNDLAEQLRVLKEGRAAWPRSHRPGGMALTAGRKRCGSVPLGPDHDSCSRLILCRGPAWPARSHICCGNRQSQVLSGTGPGTSVRA